MRMMRLRPTEKIFTLSRFVRLLAVPALVACSADEIASPNGATDKTAPRPSLGLIAYREDLVSAYDVTTGNTYEYRPLDGVLRIIRGYQVVDIELDESTQSSAVNFVLAMSENSGFVATTEGITGDFPPPQCGNGDMSGCQMNIRANPQSPARVSDSLGIIALGPNILMRRSTQSAFGLTPSVMSFSGVDPCTNLGQAIAAQRTVAISKAIAVNGYLDALLQAGSVEITATGAKVTLSHPSTVALGVFMQATDQGYDRLIQGIQTTLWNAAYCGNRKLTAALSQQNTRIMGVGGAGGAPATFVIFTCTVFTHQVSFDGGATWFTTATNISCSPQNNMS